MQRDRDVVPCKLDSSWRASVAAAGPSVRGPRPEARGLWSVLHSIQWRLSSQYAVRNKRYRVRDPLDDFASDPRSKQTLIVPEVLVQYVTTYFFLSRNHAGNHTPRPLTPTPGTPRPLLSSPSATGLRCLPFPALQCLNTG